MTNLQQNAPTLSPRKVQLIWFGVPVVGLSLVSLLFAIAVLMPLWQTLQRDSQRLRELEALQAEVSLMRQQLRAQDIQEERALQQKDKLFRLIAGSGDLSTMLAVLDREAKASGVRLQLFEPQTAPPPKPAQPANPPAGDKPPAAATNPLEQAGLQPQTMLISVRGTYPQLLSFLQRLEALSVLVIQSNLQLESAAATGTPETPLPTPAAASANKPAEITMKLSLTLYGQPARPPANSGPPAAGAAPAPAATPAAPQGQAAPAGQAATP